MDDKFLTEEMELTLLLVVDDINKSKVFFKDVLEAEVYREYGGTSVVLKLLNNWILLVTGGGPTEDKPTITFNPPEDKNRIDHQLIFRVPDCKASYELLKSRGAKFLTPPVDHGGEIRCFLRDPDGHLIELSEIVK
jgi:catechol 2,3-dioxygenase-like lactoylglutathione lyase family enzyme